MLVNSIHGSVNCLELHIFVAAGSDGVEIKYQNVQTEPVEFKDQHVQTKATSKELSMYLLKLHLWLFYCQNTFCI